MISTKFCGLEQRLDEIEKLLRSLNSKANAREQPQKELSFWESEWTSMQYDSLIMQCIDQIMQLMKQINEEFLKTNVCYKAYKQIATETLTKSSREIKRLYQTFHTREISKAFCLKTVEGIVRELSATINNIRQQSLAKMAKKQKAKKRKMSSEKSRINQLQIEVGTAKAKINNMKRKRELELMSLQLMLLKEQTMASQAQLSKEETEQSLEERKELDRKITATLLELKLNSDAACGENILLNRILARTDEQLKHFELDHYNLEQRCKAKENECQHLKYMNEELEQRLAAKDIIDNLLRQEKIQNRKNQADLQEQIVINTYLEETQKKNKKMMEEKNELHDKAMENIVTETKIKIFQMQCLVAEIKNDIVNLAKEENSLLQSKLAKRLNKKKKDYAKISQFKNCKTVVEKCETELADIKFEIVRLITEMQNLEFKKDVKRSKLKKKSKWRKSLFGMRVRRQRLLRRQLKLKAAQGKLRRIEDGFEDVFEDGFEDADSDGSLTDDTQNTDITVTNSKSASGIEDGFEIADSEGSQTDINQNTNIIVTNSISSIFEIGFSEESLTDLNQNRDKEVTNSKSVSSIFEIGDSEGTLTDVNENTGITVTNSKSVPSILEIGDSEVSLMDVNRNEDIRVSKKFVSSISLNSQNRDITVTNSKYVSSISLNCNQSILLNSLGKTFGDRRRELLRWCQQKMQPYGIPMFEFSNSWASGHALCALLHSFRPELIDVKYLECKHAAETLAYGAKIADLLGISGSYAFAAACRQRRPNFEKVFLYVQQLYIQLELLAAT